MTETTFSFPVAVFGAGHDAGGLLQIIATLDPDLPAACIIYIDFTADGFIEKLREICKLPVSEIIHEINLKRGEDFCCPEIQRWLFQQINCSLRKLCAAMPS